MTESQIVPQLPKHLSYSQVTTMLRCGEQWRLERWLHYPAAPAWALVGGTAVHHASEMVDAELTSAMNPTPPKVLFNQALDAAIEAEKGRTTDEFEDTATWRASGRASKAHPNKEDEGWWRENGPGFVSNWVRWREMSPLEIWRDDEGILAVELEAEVELAGLPVKVFIDRVMIGAQGLVIVDLKSGASVPVNGMQLGVYAHAIKATYGLDAPWGQFWNARQGVSSQSYDMSEWPKARLDYVFGSVRKMQEEGIFVPQVTSMCSACGVRRFCKAYGGELSGDVPQMWGQTYDE